MRVFDCFTFFNEFDVLEIRLEELWDQVDYFVIAEADVTHSGRPKEYLLEKNWDRYSKYHSKIRHLKLTDHPQTGNSWDIERWQRYSLLSGLNDLERDDIVIVSDCDEIPSSQAIQSIKEDTNDYDRYVLSVPLFYFKLNYMMIKPTTKQRNIMVTRGRAFTNPQEERAKTFNLQNLPLNYANEHFCVIERAGWHFTYFGDTEFAKNKIFSFAHTETAGIIGDVDNISVDYMIRNKVGLVGHNYVDRFEYVKIDDYYPSCVTADLVRWKEMIVPNAEYTVEDLYK